MTFDAEAVLVKVAVAMPEALVIALAVMEPALVVKTMVWPEMGLTPSVTVAVMVELVLPLASIDAGEDDKVSTVPVSLKATDVWAMADPAVAVILAVPLLVELVSLAVATPAEFVLVALLMVPKVVVKLTAVPIFTGLP